MNDPAAVRRVLQENEANYCKDRFQKRMLAALSGGLLTAEDTHWYSQRRLIAPLFRSSLIKDRAPAMVAAIDGLVGGWTHRDNRSCARCAGAHHFFSAGLRAFHQAVEDMIAARERDLERQETSTENDVLMLLIRARDPGTGRKLTRQEIRANVITFMAAGHESTANAITWTLYLLSRSPEWRECVRAERYKSVPKRRHCFSIG